MKVSYGAKTMALPTPAWLVGTFDAAGKPNLMTAAWGGICCSKPPCLAVSLRAATYSHGAIMARKAFTVSVPHESQAAKVDYCGLVSGRDHDKFATLGWTAVASALVDAPYVGECPLVIECKVVHVAELGLHTMFVGEICDVKVEESVLTDGKPDPSLVRPIVYAPEDKRYFGLGQSLGQGFSIGKELK